MTLGQDKGAVRRYTIKGSWCEDTSIAWGSASMVMASDYDALEAKLRVAVEALQDYARGEVRWDRAQEALATIGSLK